MDKEWQGPKEKEKMCKLLPKISINNYGMVLLTSFRRKSTCPSRNGDEDFKDIF